MLVSEIRKTSPLALLVFLCGQGVAAAAQAGLPTNVCNSSGCAADQANIWRRFENGAAPDFDRAPAVYSGHCYHKARGLNPNTAQFGGVLIDKRDSRLLFNAKFSFHVKNHPYAHLDVASARRRLSPPYPTNHEVKLSETYASVGAGGAFAPFRYWFRDQAEADGILLVGYFGFAHTILCDLGRHAD